MALIASPQPLRVRVGLAVRAARVARGLTQGELAGPYTAAFVSRVEHGDAIPSLSSLEVLTARLAMSLEDFFRLVDEQDAHMEGRDAKRTTLPPLG
jgi:transcriptional regulator with XRE-family HTH domain